MVSNQVIDIKSEIYKNFNVGERYSNVAAKDKIKTLYDALGYQKFPMASDLGGYFVTKPCKVNNPDTGKRENGIELVSKKII